MGLKALELRRRHRNMQDLLAAHAEWLQSGQYTITPNIAWERSTRVPPEISGKLNRMTENATVLDTVKRRIRRPFLAGLTYAQLSNGSGRATIIKRGNKRGSNTDVILIAPAHGTVTRLATTPVFTPEYRRTRLAIGRYLPTPTFELCADGHGITEQYIAGDSLRITQDTQKGQYAVESLLEDLRAACGSLQRPAPQDARKDFEQYLEESALVHHPAIARCQHDRLVDFLAAPQVPAHNDLAPGNILLTSSGPVVIDLAASELGYMPFWRDATNLLLRWDSPGFWKGRYDNHLQSLFDLADQPQPDPAESRYELAIANSLMSDPLMCFSEHSYIPNRTRSKTPTDRFAKQWARLGCVVDSQPNPVCPYPAHRFGIFRHAKALLGGKDQRGA
ncbi:aminoglycoside phosphotransferase family protein [Halorhodospira sp. 9621]|uniref:phosphotransferase n=1 Tax=Halorhodospira sp. 9621 TaxID=2899135 RepID=UPI001EE83B27|nr:phosphotransferase [Halorhodospira sp. 9621]MCG5533628.1 aminoglycoside phosphotransferase family protein [Halorhodospira sp. 9621]